MKKCSVTVAIPAFNEELSINNIISDVLMQKQKSFTVEEIIVISDGSTDKTNEKVIALSRKNPVITLLKGKEQKGKYYRLNQIFRRNRSDLLIILDADIRLIGNDFLEKLILVLLKSPNAIMAAGHNLLLKPSNFTGKIIHANFKFWDYVCLSLPNKNSALNFAGSATAYKGSFARTIVIPEDIKDPHLYIYLMAKKQNGFRFCRKAEVSVWPITTLKDYDTFLNRTIGKKDHRLEKIFGVKTEEVYAVPYRSKLQGFMKAFVRQPFYTSLAVFLTLYKEKIHPPKKTDKTPVWDVLTSSKNPVLEK